MGIITSSDTQVSSAQGVGPETDVFAGDKGEGLRYELNYFTGLAWICARLWTAQK